MGSLGPLQNIPKVLRCEMLMVYIEWGLVSMGAFFKITWAFTVHSVA